MAELEDDMGIQASDKINREDARVHQPGWFEIDTANTEPLALNPETA